MGRNLPAEFHHVSAIKNERSTKGKPKIVELMKYPGVIFVGELSVKHSS